LPIAVWDPCTTRLWRVPNHLDPPPEMLFDPALPAAGVPLVDPQVLDTREGIGSSIQEQRHASPVLNVRGVHLHPQDETLTIY